MSFHLCMDKVWPQPKMEYISGTGDKHSCRVSIWGLKTCRVGNSQESCQIMDMCNFDPSICLLEFPEHIPPLIKNTQRLSAGAGGLRAAEQLDLSH